MRTELRPGRLSTSADWQKRRYAEATSIAAACVPPATVSTRNTQEAGRYGQARVAASIGMYAPPGLIRDGLSGRRWTHLKLVGSDQIQSDLGFVNGLAANILLKDPEDVQQGLGQLR